MADALASSCFNPQKDDDMKSPSTFIITVLITTVCWCMACNSDGGLIGMLSKQSGDEKNDQTPQQTTNPTPQPIQQVQQAQPTPQPEPPEPKCPAGQVYCNGYCIDPMTTVGYCGAQEDCANYTNCKPNEKCIGGKCVVPNPCKPDEDYYYNKYCIVKKNTPQTQPPSIDERLTFLKSIKNKKTKKVDFLVFNDSFKNAQCIVSMQGNHTDLDTYLWCVPMTGSIPADLEYSLITTKTKQLMPDIYPYCYNQIKMGSYMPNGLATFFQKFNPDYYNSKLKWFAENTDDITVYKNAENLDFQFDPFDTYNVPDRYYKHPLSVVMSMNFDYNEPGYMKRWEWNSLDSEKISFIEHNSSVTLHKGDIILTASASKGEKKFHQYWRVESDNLINGAVYDGLVLRPGEENELPIYGDIPLIPIYDLKGKEIWQTLDNQIQTGMRNLKSYCQAANLSLNNEASSEQWASIPADSPLLKKK